MGANAQTTVPTFTASQVLTADQQNQSARTGVPVFASTVTRDAAFGGTGEKTLAEGQMCYVEGTGLQTYNAAGAWVTWGAAPATSALVYITSATVTAQTTLTVNNVFSATYLNYFMTYTDVQTSVSSNIGLQFTTGGTANANANYQIGSWRVAYNAGAGNAAGYASNQTAFLTIITDTPAPCHGFMHFFSPFATTQTGIASSGAGGNQSNWTNGIFNANTSFDGIKLTSTANITGTFRFYGISNS